MTDLELDQPLIIFEKQINSMSTNKLIYHTNVDINDDFRNYENKKVNNRLVGNTHHRNSSISTIIFESINNRNIEINKTNTSDRLFPDHPLYCEGMHKPKFRGIIHLLYALLLPLGIIHLNLASNGNIYGQISSFIFVCSNLYCVGISALYHLRNWNYNNEVWIQKLDHCAIAIYATGVNFPLSCLLLPFSLGIILIISSLLACIWTCWNVLNNRPAVWRFFVVSSMVMLFFPILYYEMTSFEFFCAVLNGIIQGIGAIVFVNRYPNPSPNIFGYHEIFHFITIIGMTVTYTCNWSIIHRTCNPYARHIDIIDLIMHYVGVVVT